MNDKKYLMKQIRAYSFAVYEAALYLDGHPDDSRAMEYFEKWNGKLAEATDKYEKRYGPLTIYGAGGRDWRWTADPWPWEYDSMS